MRRSTTAMAALLAMSVPACTQPSGSALPLPTASRAEIDVSPVPYQLNIHCGINYVPFRNRIYQAVEPIPNTDGNPPKGWPGIVQDGTMHQVSATEIEFRDNIGHRVLFRLDPATKLPGPGCD